MLRKHRTHEKNQKHLRIITHLSQKEILTPWRGCSGKRNINQSLNKVKRKTHQRKLRTYHPQQKSRLQSHCSRPKTQIIRINQQEKIR